MNALLTIVLFVVGIVASRSGHGHGCPELHRGTFVIDQYQLYAENADWYPVDCVVLFGALWNASVVIYDPYKDQVLDILEFPGITRSATYHIGGVAWDQYTTDIITILVDSAAPWATGGNDVSGDNLVMKYNIATKKILWTANLTAVTQGKYGGFQDVEHDSRGNTYVVGSYPSSIMRVDKLGKNVVPWYPPQSTITNQYGYGGLAALGDILLTNAGNGQIYRFDMRQERGVPVNVPIRPNVTFHDEDAIYMPPMYEGRVLLVASQGSGLQVLRSKDAKWEWAEHLGVIPSPTGGLYEGSLVVAAVQMGSNSVYLLDEFFSDPWVPGLTAGNRTRFPMPDVTAQIEELLKKA
ncbi:hypothetical protein GQ53DRAFT_664233 [Thozetella sp. PMI_491]|nr:hypothetical protein GQ53DRAFT_664233 [Thozetella sp. PMI_491]